jgi:hypothetical protein
MQINIRPAQTGAGAYSTIADSANGDLIDYRPPTLKTLEQIEPLAGSSTRFVANRGNALVNIAIPIRQFFDTDIRARQAIATLITTLNIGPTDLQILDVDSADATYMPACSLGDLTPGTTDGQTGVAIHYTLKFTGNTFTTIAP